MYAAGPVIGPCGTGTDHGSTAYSWREPVRGDRAPSSGRPRKAGLRPHKIHVKAGVDAGPCGHTAGAGLALCPPGRREPSSVTAGGGRVTYPPEWRTVPVPAAAARARGPAPPARAAAGAARYGVRRGQSTGARRGDHRAGAAPDHRRAAGPAGRGVRRGDGLARSTDRDAAADDVSTAASRSARTRRRSTARWPTPTRRRPAASWRARQETGVSCSGYEEDITTAAELLVDAAASNGQAPSTGPPDRPAQRAAARYNGLVERARANNRQGLPARRRLSALRQRADAARDAAGRGGPLPAGEPAAERRLRRRDRRGRGAASRWASSRWPHSPGRSAATTADEPGVQPRPGRRDGGHRGGPAVAGRWATRWPARS